MSFSYLLNKQPDMQTRPPSQRLYSPTKAKLARDGKTMAQFFPDKYSTSSATVRTRITRASVAETIRRRSSSSDDRKGRTRTRICPQNSPPLAKNGKKDSKSNSKQLTRRPPADGRGQNNQKMPTENKAQSSSSVP